MSHGKLTDLEVLRRLFGIARPFWKNIAGVLLLEFASIPLLLLLPLPVKLVVDSVIGSEPLPDFISAMLPETFKDSGTSLLLCVVALQILFVVLYQIQSTLSWAFQTFTGESISLRFKSILLSHVQRLSFAFHDKRGSADSIFRIQYDAPAIQQITLFGTVPLVISFCKILGMIGVIFFINTRLALVAFSVVPLLYFLGNRYRKIMRPRYQEVKKLESRTLGIVQETLTSFRVIKAFGREEREQGRYRDKSTETLYSKTKLSFADGLFSLSVNFVTAIGTAGIIFFGASSVITGAMSLGELLMVLTYLSQFYGPLQAISKKAAALQTSLAGAHRAFELLDQVPDVKEKPDAQRIYNHCQGKIEFKNVTFEYEPGNPILQNVSFKIGAGSRIGIKGKTGSGKTTLISLLPRFYDVKEGSILLDGLDTRDYKLDDLRKQFSLVLQDSILFSTTIRDNIAYAKDGAKFEEIVEASKAANAHSFIMDLPDGYDTLVGESGMRLSGGERQRIALARAFLKDAPILLLDEATSSVDTQTEAMILGAMERLMENRTTLIIAHRLNTIEKCDWTLEVSGGTVTCNKTILVEN